MKNYFADSFRSVFIQSNNLSTKAKSLPISSIVNKDITQASTPTNESVIEKVNNQLSQQNEGRLFAVVHLCGKQFKITAGDIVMVQGYWPPNIGDKLRLDKVDSIAI